ncbi:MAG: hypothetical protein M3O46_00345 [Myxococcota bacterium]|nr:hypothetical protein [Myxococcota bacterium]
MLSAALPIAIACSSSSSTSSAKDPAQACKDTADAVAKAGVRCGRGTYGANYDQFVQSAGNGNCANVVSVRDATSLYNTCIPSLSTISCAGLQALMIDASCKGQLLHMGFQLRPIANDAWNSIGAPVAISSD